MSDTKEKYTPNESQRADNPLGRIIVSVLSGLACALMVYKIYAEYKAFLIPFIVIIGFAIILATVWIKGLYIYRYLLPAMIIIMVFTAYPILYTVYIAFTNFGTGHMQTKEDARKILINKVWDVDYTKSSLYAEFYLEKDKKYENYKADYRRERDKYLKENKLAVQEFLKEPVESYLFKSSVLDLLKNQEDIEFVQSLYVYDEELMEYRLNESINNNDYEKLVKTLDGINFIYLYDIEDQFELIIDELVNKNFSELSKKDFSLILYSKSSILKENVVLKAEDSDEEYEAESILMLDKKTNTIKEISYDELIEFQKSKALVGDYVFQREDVERAPKIYINLFDEFYTSLRQDNPLVYENDGEKYDYLLEQSNQFFVKKHSYIMDKNNNFKRLEISDDGSLGGYDISVFEDNKYGKFVITKDNQKVRFWKEYGISRFEFDYGIMRLEKDALAEEYLLDNAYKQGLMDKISKIDMDSISGVEVSKVNSTALQKVNKSIKEVNKEISKFNGKISGLRKEYIKNGVDKIADSSFLSDSEKRKAIRIMKRSSFPKVSPIKILKEEMSNIDYSIGIEPGYMVTVGLSNFTKIASSRNITTPFIRVFFWTIAWAGISVISSFAMGLALALIFNSSNLKGKYFYRTIFILPYAIPGFVSILMWQGFLNEDFGVINKFFNVHIPWITSSGVMAKVSVLVVNLWLSFPYFMLICLGALQSIDESMYEAADVDGATKIQQFSLITLPLLLIALGPMLVGSFAFAFNNFAGIYLLTSGGPVMAAGVLPGHTDILISYTYKLAFGEQNKDYGLASAIAIIVFFIIGTITFLQFKFTGTFKEVDNA